MNMFSTVKCSEETADYVTKIIQLFKCRATSLFVFLFACLFTYEQLNNL